MGVYIEILYCSMAKLVEYPAHLHSIICVWVLQNTPGIHTHFMDTVNIVMAVSQYEANFIWKRYQELGSNLAIIFVGWSEICS